MKELDSLEKSIKNAEKHFLITQQNFDVVNNTCREMIRECARGITYIHNDKIGEAQEILKSIEKKHKSLSTFEDRFGYIIMQAYQEMAEMQIFYDIKNNNLIPTPNNLEINYDSYILGLMDVVGELKREVLNALHKNDIESAKKYYNKMVEIYDTTRHIRFAEPILPGFRKKQDVARIQIENAGSDILKRS